MIILGSSEQAEAAFYAAFAACSVQGMDAVWAETDAVCIHPGSAALVGKTAVMNSWAKILGAGSTVDIQHELVTRTSTDEIAIHIVREILIQNNSRVEVMATNVYRCQDGDWKIIEHHGSQSVVQSRTVPTHSAAKRTLQ